MHVLTGIAHVNHWMANGELKYMYTYEYRHYACILNGLSVSGLVMEAHGLGSAPVKSVSSVQRIAVRWGVFNSGWSAKVPLPVTFPLYFDSILPACLICSSRAMVFS